MKNDRILLSMGAGGKQSGELMRNVFLRIYGNETLGRLDDAAELNFGNTRLAFTTDSYTIKPIFFPGGDIGTLAVCGTVNDLAVKGAKPVAISAGFIIEEGFPRSSLETIAASMQRAAAESGVQIVAGDTKVVGAGEADGIFINTSGIGIIPAGMNITSSRAQPGDDIIVSGPIADHGTAILNAREGLDFSPAIESDVAPVAGIVEAIGEYAEHLHVMRDPTRGGVASVVNEIAAASHVTIRLFESQIPVRPGVARCCDLLGLDPLYVANEGKVVIFCAAEATAGVLERMRALPACREAVAIGKVEDAPFVDTTPPVSLMTPIGTTRFVPLIEGEPLPRIC